MSTAEDDRVVAELRRTFDEAAGRAPVMLERSTTAARRPLPRERMQRVLVACLAIAVLIPLSFAVVHSESSVPTVAASGRAAIEPAAPGWRWEMWANVQLQVPDTWDRNQDIFQACSLKDETPGFVSRGDTGSGIMEICPDWAQAPTSRPNVAFVDAFPGAPEPGTRSYPNGTVTVKKIGSVEVMVTAKDAALRRRILDSAEVVTGTNAAGCPVAAQIPAFGHAASTGPSVADVRSADLVSVCRYRFGSASYAFTLSGTKAAAVVTALRQAPGGVGPNDPKDCEPAEPEDDVGLYRLWSGSHSSDVWVHWDTCRGHGIDDGTGTRRLTADVLAPFIGVAYGGDMARSVPTRTATTPPGRAPVYQP
jgi:hypothetical protein